MSNAIETDIRASTCEGAAESSQRAGLLARRIAEWRRRRLAVEELPRFSDHHLADLGLSRGEVAFAVHRCRA